MPFPSSPSQPRRAVQIQPGADAGERAGTRAELVIFWVGRVRLGGERPTDDAAMSSALERGLVYHHASDNVVL